MGKCQYEDPPLCLQVQSRRLKSLPEVFMFNCRMDHGKDVDFWKSQQEVSLTTYFSSIPFLLCLLFLAFLYFCTYCGIRIPILCFPFVSFPPLLFFCFCSPYHFLRSLVTTSSLISYVTTSSLISYVTTSSHFLLTSLTFIFQALNPPKQFEGKATTQTFVKSCRYGDKCTRRDCKFRHDKDETSDAPRLVQLSVFVTYLLKFPVPSRLTFPCSCLCSWPVEQDDEEPNTWLPSAIKVMLSDDEGLVITRLEEVQRQSFVGALCVLSLFTCFSCFQDQKVKCSEGEVVYDLFASVGHIQDIKSGGNLVAHIHVGTTFHSRKEVKTVVL